MDKKLEKYTKPFIRNNEISENDFDKLFSNFEEDEMERVLDFFYERDIEIVSKTIESKIIRTTTNNINLSNEILCVMYQRGDKSAMDTLIEKNTRLIYSRVSKYVNRYKHDLTEEDLFQEGCKGFFKAVEKFDKDMENKLTTYAIYWIDQVIIRAIADKGYTIRVPVHMFDKVNKYYRILRDLEKEDLPEDLKKESIIESMGINVQALDNIKYISKNILNPTSLDLPIGEEEDTYLIDMIEAEQDEDIFDIVSYILLKEKIDNALDLLPDREREILMLRFGINDNKMHTLQEIGEIYGVTRERIRQIESKVLKKLRRMTAFKELKEYLDEF